MESADWMNPAHNSSSPARYLVIASGPVGAVAAATLCGAGDYRAAFSVAAAAVGLAVLLTARPSLETVLLFWFVTSPVSSFLLRLPSDDPILTFDRGIFGVLGLILLANRVRAASRARLNGGVNVASDRLPQKPEREGSDLVLAPQPHTLSPPAHGFEVSWVLLCAIALASVATQSASPGYAMRIAVDSFCLPLIAFHAARHYTKARSRNSVFLLGATVALSLFLFTCGVYESLTHIDVFPFEGSQLVRENEIRVNGPFNSDSSYAVICVMLAIFLRAAPRVFGVRLDRSSRVLCWSAFGCALAAALLPLYRVVAVAIVVSWMIIEAGLSRGRRHNWQSRARILFSGRALVGTAILLSALVTAGLLLQSSQGRLASARNVFSRLATWEAAARIAWEHPLLGVGLTNYNEQFNQRYSRADQWRSAIGEARPMAYPHSNSLWIAAELGAGAFALYILASVSLMLMGYSGWKQAVTSQQKAAAGCFLALLAAYSISGLTLTSGAYSDLNLYFFFFLGLISTLMGQYLRRPG